MSFDNESKYHRGTHYPRHPQKAPSRGRIYPEWHFGRSGKPRVEMKQSGKRRSEGSESAPKRQKREAGKFTKTSGKSKRSFKQSSKPRAMVKGRKMLKGKRSGVPGGSYGEGHKAFAISPFSMRPSKAGTMIRRVYEQQTYVGNTAAIFDAVGYSIAMQNNAGTISMNWYVGNLNGTLVGAFNDFQAENAHYLDVFRWVKLVGVEWEFIPIVNGIQEQGSSSSDTTVQADAGQMRIVPWDGDTDIVSAAGIFNVDWNEVSRMKGKYFSPIGGKSVTFAKVPQIFTTNADIVTSGTPRWTFPPCPAMDTVAMRTASASAPGYGCAWYWNHPGLAANANKVSILVKCRVMVQWNTLYDADIAAAKAQAKADQFRGYDPAMTLVSHQKAKMEDDLLSYDMADVKITPKAPPPSPKIGPIVKNQQAKR